MNIRSMEELGQLAKAGWHQWTDLGMIKPSYYKYHNVDYVMLTYTAECGMKPPEEWNFVERQSRGLILCRETGDVIARPFEKFWNANQVSSPNSSIHSIYEKLDGSLGITYWLPHSERPFICTKGSFSSEQALIATEWIHNRYDTRCLDRNYTYLFEIIYPSNRIVVNYGDREELVLLSIRNRHTGSYLAWRSVEKIARMAGFGLPQVYHFNNPDEIAYTCKNLTGNVEGYVVEFKNGQRIKYKGEEYVRIHRIISTISFKNALAAYSIGQIDHYVATIPDTHLDEVLEYINIIETEIGRINTAVENIWVFAPKATRKEFAQYVMTECTDYYPYLFAKWDNKPIEPLVLKYAFKKKIAESINEEILLPD